MEILNPDFKPYAAWRAAAASQEPPPEARSCRVAVIGLGAQGAKLAKAAVDGGFDLVAVCDSDPARLKEFKFEGGGRRPALLRDARELKPGQVDVCIIATLADSHLALLRILKGDGIQNILCEKPIANRVRDLRALPQIMSAGMNLAVNHSKLWSPDYQFARAAIQAEPFGPLRNVTIRFKSGGFGNIGSHLLAALCYLSGKRITSVIEAEFQSSASVTRKKGFADPNGRAQFLLEGVRVDVDNRAVADTPPNLLRFEFERGLFELNDEWNQFRFLDYRTGVDRGEWFKLPWQGTRRSWPVLVHLLRCSLLELRSGMDRAKLESACCAAEAVIAAQLSAVSGGPVDLPLPDSTETPFLFS